ncbi:hypothetical protein L1887_21809 [Cichorium endivia]|nr:hypothetical protein L1887_21809 [Cichorium endivia]
MIAYKRLYIAFLPLLRYISSTTTCKINWKHDDYAFSLFVHLLSSFVDFVSLICEFCFSDTELWRWGITIFFALMDNKGLHMDD